MKTPYCRQHSGKKRWRWIIVDSVRVSRSPLRVYRLNVVCDMGALTEADTHGKLTPGCTEPTWPSADWPERCSEAAIAGWARTTWRTTLMLHTSIKQQMRLWVCDVGWCMKYSLTGSLWQLWTYTWLVFDNEKNFFRTNLLYYHKIYTNYLINGHWLIW